MWITLIAAVAFALRVFPRLLLPDAFGPDTLFHLFAARAMRANGYRLPARYQRILMPGPVTYPFFYHLLLAPLPHRLQLWAERLTGAVCDTAILLASYAFALRHWPDGVRHLGLTVPEWVAALYAVCPALLRLGSGPRAYNGSPRVLGQFLYVTHLLLAFEAWRAQDWRLALASALAAAVAVLNAKFTVQSLLLFSPFLAAMVSWWYLPLLAAGLALSWLISGGLARRVVEGHVRHSYFYCRHLQQVYIHPTLGSLREYLARGRDHVLGIARPGGPRKAWGWWLTEPFHLHQLLASQGHLWLALASLRAPGWDDPLRRFLHAWAAGGVAWFFATKTRPLSFLGEGERYLEYACLPLLLLAVPFAAQSCPWILPALLAYGVATALSFQHLYHHSLRDMDASYRASQGKFDELNAQPTATILPVGPFAMMALARTEHRVAWIPINIDERHLPATEFMFVAGNMPFPSDHLGLILERYQVDYLLTSPPHLKRYIDQHLRDPALFDRLAEKVWEQPMIALYRVRKAGGQEGVRP